jgi:hypothetical protein
MVIELVWLNELVIEARDMLGGSGWFVVGLNGVFYCN